MNLHDDHLPPAWMERGNYYHWEDLTETELALEALAERPRHDTPPPWAGSLGEPFKAQEKRP